MPEAQRPTPTNQFSFSRLKAYAQCPLRYRYRYLKGLREAFVSIESHLGKAVHRTLEWLYERRRDGAAPDLDQTLERFAGAWGELWSDEVAVVRVASTPDDYIRSGREMLGRFHREIFTHDRSETVALEQRFSLRLSPEVAYTGFADRVGRTSSGRLFVIDYKTSRSRGDARELSEGLQAPLYASCALRRFGGGEALAGYHYLRHGVTSWQLLDVARGRELEQRFLALAEEAIAATEHPATPGVLCAWCGFNHLCPSADVPASLAGGLDHAV